MLPQVVNIFHLFLFPCGFISAVELKDIVMCIPSRKAMTNLDSVLKNRDITLPTIVYLIKAMVFPVVMYGWM